MEWSESLSVGVERIDSQHRELISRVNAFFVATKAEKGPEEVKKVLDFLSSYVVTHFAEEEALQVQYGYPDYQAHRKLHQDFVKEVASLRSELEKSGFTAAGCSLVGMTLVNWLVSHISMQDKSIGKYIKSKA